MKFKFAVVGLSLAALNVASSAKADIIPYPNAGAENPITYTFTAAATGDLIAYFYGSGASFSETLGLRVNGTNLGITGLENHSTAVGTALNFGPVTAGDNLVFYINVATTNEVFYSDPTLNSDGENHIYSTTFSGGSGIPAGVYVGFEDLNGTSGSDHNYQDEQFVFTNTTLTAAVPEPSTWAMMILGFFGVGFIAYRQRRNMMLC